MLQQLYKLRAMSYPAPFPPASYDIATWRRQTFTSSPIDELSADFLNPVRRGASAVSGGSTLVTHAIVKNSSHTSPFILHSSCCLPGGPFSTLERDGVILKFFAQIDTPIVWRNMSHCVVYQMHALENTGLGIARRGSADQLIHLLEEAEGEEEGKLYGASNRAFSS
eukprot:2272719-Amphidinium_carterae.1